jgi:hypothetical protein
LKLESLQISESYYKESHRISLKNRGPNHLITIAIKAAVEEIVMYVLSVTNCIEKIEQLPTHINGTPVRGVIVGRLEDGTIGQI